MKLEKALDDTADATFYVKTAQGTRKQQQDAAFAEVRGELTMAVLCDGMGGMKDGEKAGQTGVEYFVRDFREKCQTENIPKFLKEEAKRLDKRIYGLTDEEGNRLNAGSTIVAAIIKENKLYWMSVGDSRLYMFRNGKLKCLTAAHNYKVLLEEKLTAGAIDKAYYDAQISQGEALTSYLGIGNLLLMDRNERPLFLREEDILLICSDGLFKLLEDEKIEEILKESGGKLQQAVEKLMEAAAELGKNDQDNTTVILAKRSLEKKNKKKRILRVALELLVILFLGLALFLYFLHFNA